MKIFREKQFGAKSKAVKEALLRNTSNPVALASLGVSSTGLYQMNKSRKANEARLKQADKQHKADFDQQERLIKALTGVEKGLKNIPAEQPKPKSTLQKDDSWLKIGGKKIFSIREKSYGAITNSAAKGALAGSTVGAGLALQFMKRSQLGSPRAKAMVPLVGAALGGLAGSLWGVVKTLDTKISQSLTGHKLIEEVIKNLKRAGYREGQQWTLDPKKATLMKSKVCVVLSQSADNTGILINMANDQKLKEISVEITNSLPTGFRETEKISDRFNEIQISSFPDKTDATYIFTVLEKFIKRGFPVYLIEVG
jgi:hypothetical protein